MRFTKHIDIDLFVAGSGLCINSTGGSSVAVWSYGIIWAIVIFDNWAELDHGQLHARYNDLPDTGKMSSEAEVRWQV